MDSSRLASIVLNCRPIGRKRLERALKGLLEGVTWKGFEGTVGGGPWKDFEGTVRGVTWKGFKGTVRVGDLEGL